MKSLFAQLAVFASATKSPKFWWCCSAAGVLLAGGLLMSYLADPTKTPPASPVSMAALIVHPSATWVAQDSVPDAVMSVDLYKFALNAFLVPLFDESVPPKWTDAAMNFTCDGESTVMIDGEPMVSGKQIPAGAFTVRWNMNRCAPFGRESVEINGSVELVVARSVKGLRAKVTPNELRVDSLNSRAWLRKPFDAEIELDTLVAMPRSKVAHP